MKLKLAKIALSLCVCMFSGLACIAGTLAWLGANKLTRTNEMELAVDLPEATVKYTIYKYDEGNNVISTTDKNELYLKSYDSVIKEKNEYTPIILKFDVSGPVIKNRNSFNLEYVCSETDYTTKYISNIVQFNTNYLTINSNDAETIYTTAVAALTTDTTTFVNGTSKETELYHNVSNYDSYVVGNNLTIYIKIDYSETLIETNFSEIEIATEQATSSMKFDNDLVRIGFYE